VKTHAKKPITFLISLLTAVAGLAGQGVSPGNADSVAAIEQRCPTFNWEASDGVALYDLVAYALPGHLGDAAVLEADLRDAEESLYATVPGGASGWTPSADQCLEPGTRHVWFVRAAYEVASSEVLEVGEWSEGRYFAIPAAPSTDEVARALGVIQRYVAEGGELATIGERPVTAPAASPSSAAGHGSRGTLKSVPGAAAAIRGDNPDGGGESYGVIGTSASAQGAGLGAANTAGGADLVLDGSADGQADTRLSQSALDRPSASDENFTFRNTGGGLLDVHVTGDLSASTVTGDEIWVPAGMVIDDEGAWLGEGSTIPCNGCVTEADIDPNAELDAETLNRQHASYYRNATNLNAGTVSTSRYSAMADLGAEGHLGNSLGDLAQNNSTLQTGLNADQVDGYHSSDLQPRIVFESAGTQTSAYIGSTCSTYPGSEVTITTPGAGKYMVEANVRVVIQHTSGTKDTVALALGASPGDCGQVPDLVLHRVVADAPTASMSRTMTVRRLFTFSTGGTRTFRVNGYMGHGWAADTDHFASTMVPVMFYPD